MTRFVPDLGMARWIGFGGIALGLATFAWLWLRRRARRPQPDAAAVALRDAETARAERAPHVEAAHARVDETHAVEFAIEEPTPDDLDRSIERARALAARRRRP